MAQCRWLADKTDSVFSLLVALYYDADFFFLHFKAKKSFWSKFMLRLPCCYIPLQAVSLLNISPELPLLTLLRNFQTNTRWLGTDLAQTWNPPGLATVLKARWGLFWLSSGLKRASLLQSVCAAAEKRKDCTWWEGKRISLHTITHLQHQSKVWTHHPLIWIQTFDWYCTLTVSVTKMLPVCVSCVHLTVL